MHWSWACRVMTSAEAVGSSFLAHRGQHVCLFQVFDHRVGQTVDRARH